MRRAVLIAAVGGWMLLAVPASAVIEGPCDGSVTIGGVTYGPENDTPDDPIVVPAERSGVTADWEATTGTPITDHAGTVGIVVGPVTIEIADWNGENAENETDASGSYDLASLPVTNLTGLYEVTGSHSGEGGTCSGSVMVLLEGNPLSNPVGAASVGGLLLAGVGTVLAGRGRAA
ncbi:MAG: hypothetical protein R3246_00895 [Acidimicrobiia bacterium]|nr:hypothetical protein [Acidimicrobiia bacterium]